MENPNLEILDFWWFEGFPWGIMINPWSNDKYHLKNVDIDKKILKFDCMLIIVDFLPNIVDFQSSEPLIEQACDVGLQTWHG